MCHAELANPPSLQAFRPRCMLASVVWLGWVGPCLNVFRPLFPLQLASCNNWNYYLLNIPSLLSTTKILMGHGAFRWLGLVAASPNAPMIVLLRRINAMSECQPLLWQVNAF